MSDEDDERMDRAKRIRRMREGQRSDDEGDSTEEEADDGAAETGDDLAEESPADDGTEPEDGPDSAGEPVETKANDETNADETDAVSRPDEDDETVGAEAGAEEHPAQTVEHATAAADQISQQTRADGSTTETTEEDSMSEHTSASETEASGETDDETPDPEAIAQRAAQAAASVSGGGTETETTQTTGGEPTPAETAAAIQGASGVDLPDQEQIDTALEAANESIETADETPTEANPGPTGVESETTTEESTRVLEFTLGEEHYCIDISLVEEIVKRDTITRVPNTDDYIEGVVDLRGQITTILDPKALLDIDAEGSETLMIVFDPEAFDDQGAIGWIVDEVRQVAPIRESEINDPPVEEDYIHGVVDREDGFVIWTKPEVAITLATADGDESE